MPIVTGNQRQQPAESMPRPLPGLSFRLLAALLPLALGACADTVTSEQLQSSAQLRRDYDKTLTKAEQKAAIKDLQSATAKPQDTATPNQTASAGAKPAEKSY
jgi:hypothetical protein